MAPFNIFIYKEVNGHEFACKCVAVNWIREKYILEKNQDANWRFKGLFRKEKLDIRRYGQFQFFT